MTSRFNGAVRNAKTGELLRVRVEPAGVRPTISSGGVVVATYRIVDWTPKTEDVPNWEDFEFPEF